MPTSASVKDYINAMESKLSISRNNFEKLGTAYKKAENIIIENLKEQLQ